jgi:methyltransferase (TIGR00027 family)
MIDARWPGARSSGVARTRLVDDLLLRALQNGVEQVVILGAGFDCRAYRLPGIDRVRVIEVDHPDTQQAKRRHLQHFFGNLPDHVRFAPLDFNHQRLEEIVPASGLDEKRSTFYLWEGVTNYLTAPAVEATFRAMRRLASSSQVLFTYVHSAVLDPKASFPGKDRLRKTLQRAGEVWTFGFNPAELKDYLDRRGFRLVEDIGSVEYRTRYLGAHPRLLRGYEFYRVAMATSQ